MPQFDQSSFLNQVFWLLFLLADFYFFISYYLLPTLCKNIKFRNKKLYNNSTNLISLNFERLNKTIQLNQFYRTLFSNFESYSNEIKTLNNKQLNVYKKGLLSNSNLNAQISLFLSRFNLIMK